MPRSLVLNEQMRAESRRKILSTARLLFARQGFFNVRISEIARQAGMSPGNIYWYFPSKEEILKVLIGDFLEAYDEMLVQAEKFTGDARQRLFHLIDLQIDILDQLGENFKIFMSILGHGGGTLLETLGLDPVETGKRYQEHLGNILTGAIQKGVIQAQHPLFLSIAFFSFFNGLLLTYNEEWRMVPRQFITQAALRLLGYQEGNPV